MIYQRHRRHRRQRARPRITTHKDSLEGCPPLNTLGVYFFVFFDFFDFFDFFIFYAH